VDSKENRRVLMKKIFAFFLLLCGAGIIAFLAFGNVSIGKIKQNTITNSIQNPIKLSIPEEITEFRDGVSKVIKDTDKDTLDSVMEFVKEKSDSGMLSSKEGIREAIEEAETQFGTAVSEDTKEKIATSLSELENLGFSSEFVVSKTEELYDRYGSEFVDHMEEAFVDAAKEAASNAAQNVWDNTKETISSSLSETFNSGENEK